MLPGRFLGIGRNAIEAPAGKDELQETPVTRVYKRDLASVPNRVATI
jgi:hypothetical protein